MMFDLFGLVHPVCVVGNLWCICWRPAKTREEQRKRDKEIEQEGRRQEKEIKSDGQSGNECDLLQVWIPCNQLRYRW